MPADTPVASVELTALVADTTTGIAHNDVVVSTGIPNKTWRDLDACNGDYDKLGATTTVIPPVNGESPYYERAYLIPHEALRFDMLLLERAIQPQYFQTDRHWKIKRVCNWYHKFFLPFLHHHHEIEETIIFPRYRAKPGVIVPAELMSEHEDVLKQLESIGVLLNRMVATMDEKPLAAMADQLRTEVTAMADSTRAHFATEEVDLVKIVRDHVTPDEEAEVVKIIVGTMTFTQLSMNLPHVAAGQRRAGGTKLEQRFLSELPPPPLILYRNFWKSQYDVEHVQYISEVCLDSVNEPSIKRSHCFGCLRYY